MAIIDTAFVDARYERLERDYQELMEQVRINEERHRTDIETIGCALIEEADDRDWCSLYDDFIERVNSSLNIPLPVREHRYRIDRTFTVHVTQWVNASTYDAACNIAEDAVQEYDVLVPGCIHNGHLDIGDALGMGNELVDHAAVHYIGYEVEQDD